MYNNIGSCLTGDDLKRKELEFAPGLPLKPGKWRMKTIMDSFSGIATSMVWLMLYTVIDMMFISTG